MKKPTTPPLLWLICVNYNSDESTRQCVRAFSEIDSAEEIEIVVVDNSSRRATSQTLSDLERNNNAVRVMRPGKNLGYFGGAAWGLEEMLRVGPLPAWVVVSNSDIVPADLSFITTLKTIADASCASVIAPSITAMPSETQQNPYMISRPSKFRMQAYAFIYRHRLFFGLYEILSNLRAFASARARRVQNLLPSSESRTIYAPHGAFILFNRSYFEKGGHIRFGSFLYGEEIFVAEIARSIDAEVSFEPRLSLVHQEHVSTRLLGRKRITKYAGQSMRYLRDSFFL